MAKWSTKSPHYRGGGLYRDGDLIAVSFDDQAVAEIARKMSVFDEMLALARFVAEHPHAAFGMGDAPHAQRIQMQEMAEKVIAGVEGTNV